MAAFALSDEAREAIEAAMRPATAEKRVVLRAQAVLLFADGVGATDVARLLGVNPRTATKWKKRFSVQDPLARLADAPRSGRPPSLFPR
jgi:transposase